MPQSSSLPPARPARRRAWPALAVASCLVGFAVVPGVAAAQKITVAHIAVDDAKEVLATVESVRSPQARTRIGGTLVSVSVSEGDRVTKGDVLAVVDDPKLKLQLAAFDARIAALDAKLSLVQTDLDRARQLRASGSASQARLDDAETQMTVTQAEIAAARADKASISEQVIEGRVLAPDSGRVLKVAAVAGQVMMPGEPVATLATSSYILKLRLPERHARFMHEGDPVMVAARGLDRGRDAPHTKGRILRVYPELDQGRVVADAEAEGIGDYFVGERISVFVATGKRDAIVVPEAAIIAREGLTFVRVSGIGEVPVQTGQRHLDENGKVAGIEVLTGLKPGDEVTLP